MKQLAEAASRDIGMHEVVEELGREQTGASYLVFACLAAAASACSAFRCSHSRVDSISVMTIPPLTHTAAQGIAGSSAASGDLHTAATCLQGQPNRWRKAWLHSFALPLPLLLTCHVEWVLLCQPPPHVCKLRTRVPARPLWFICEAKLGEQRGMHPSPAASMPRCADAAAHVRRN